MNEANKQVLVAGIERCLGSRITNITKQTILAYGRNDLATIIACLNQWESEGKLRILRPLDDAQDSDEVVQMLSYIEGKSPWP